ncbi:hypothetical protein [Dendronalium sp. ChiSLP03b]|uniref:hypothetical protein n=1 Tax=Dendronalium sp. ChiSLP03b TaxID=3075381 RepID=UPI002AD35147|nr:hypothetical protein [Dendronalium sp. ChiSLP03b]MDZ8203173.1 hypothetical protein [Dendronalium sp. ChiSLP03b]
MSVNPTGLISGGTLSGTVDGNGGDDVVKGNTTNSLTWTLTGTDAGTVTGITGGFTNIANLKVEMPEIPSFLILTAVCLAILMVD